MTDEPLNLEIKIEAPPEVVFTYLTDPEKLQRWHAQHASFDPRPGGAFRLDILPGSTAIGEVVELDPPNRLVISWGWEGNEAIPPGSTTVEFTLEATGDYTLLRLAHRGLPGPEAVALHNQGWTHYLGRLTVLAAGGDPGPDPQLARGEGNA